MINTSSTQNKQNNTHTTQESNTHKKTSTHTPNKTTNITSTKKTLTKPENKQPNQQNKVHTHIEPCLIIVIHKTNNETTQTKTTQNMTY